MFDLILTAWSPLFVGNGHSYTKKEYMHDIRSGKVSFFDAQKFFSFLVERDLVEKYTQFMLSGQSSLWEFLTRDCRIPDTDLKPLTRYQVAVGDTLELREIHAFQRDAYGRAYVPGSSVKGALRTAWLLNAVLDDTAGNHTLPPPSKNKKVAFPEEDYVNLLRLSQKRRSDAVNSIFRGIQISDSQPIPDERMMLAGKFDAFTNGGFSLNSNRGIPLRRECVAPNTRIRFRLTLDQVNSQRTHHEGNSGTCHSALRCLLSADLRPEVHTARRQCQPTAAAVPDSGRRCRVLFQVAGISLPG